MRTRELSSGARGLEQIHRFALSRPYRRSADRQCLVSFRVDGRRRGAKPRASAIRQTNGLKPFSPNHSASHAQRNTFMACLRSNRLIGGENGFVTGGCHNPPKLRRSSSLRPILVRYEIQGKRYPPDVDGAADSPPLSPASTVPKSKPVVTVARLRPPRG
jgi:hypothetical protein